MIPWTGYDYKTIEYIREQRFAGKTKYSYKKMLNLSMDATFAFSSKPLKISSFLGILTSGIAAIAIPIILYQKYFLKIVIPGWTSIMIAIFFIGGIQLLAIGILGEYIGRIYDESKKRPLYIIKNKY